MKIGIAFANTGPFSSSPGVTDLARAAEDAGIESLWTVEHVIYPEAYESAYPYSPTGKMPAETSTPIPDPLVWLAFAGAVTSLVKLATGILILPQRNPLVLAKEVATLDALSGGRVMLGIGVGWLREEFDALGVPWEARGRRTDEYVEAMRALWKEDRAAYDGEFTSFTAASSNPKPANGTVPIHVGGHSRAAAERAGRLGDGFFPGKGDVAELADIVRQTAADCGRDPSAIEISAATDLRRDDPLAKVEELSAAGADRLIVPAFRFAPDPAAALGAFGEQVVQPALAL
jgi:probable F420-dependent oxidoreductase